MFWIIYQESGTVKIDYRAIRVHINNFNNISAFYYLAAGVPTVNPPTIKLLNDTTTSSVVFTLAELMTHWNGSLEYCRSFGGNDGGGAGTIPQSIPVVALLAVLTLTTKQAVEYATTAADGRNGRGQT